MVENDPLHFQRKIYNDLDEKLRASGWKSGASEAHGLLAGLACRGVTSSQVANKRFLFQIDEKDDIAMLQGLFELISTDLESSEPTFNPLLADEDSASAQRIDEVANWCAGFIQGFCNDGSSVINECNDEIQELLQDIMDISGMQAGTMSASTVPESGEEDRELTEIEEYLRVGIQLIYDEMVGFTRPAVHPAADEIH